MARQPVGDHPAQREDEGGNHDRGATYPTSATTPPSGKMRAGTMTAAATYPTSAVEPPIARTANGIATSATAVSGHRDGVAGQQQPEVAVAQRPRPHFHVTLPYLGNGGRVPDSLTA